MPQKNRASIAVICSATIAASVLLACWRSRRFRWSCGPPRAKAKPIIGSQTAQTRIRCAILSAISARSGVKLAHAGVARLAIAAC